MYGDLDLDQFERRHAILFKKLKKERVPVGPIEGPLEELWLSQFVSASMREDPLKMKIAQSALKKLITARRKGQ